MTIVKKKRKTQYNFVNGYNIIQLFQSITDHSDSLESILQSLSLLLKDLEEIIIVDDNDDLDDKQKNALNFDLLLLLLLNCQKNNNHYHQNSKKDVKINNKNDKNLRQKNSHSLVILELYRISPDFQEFFNAWEFLHNQLLISNESNQSKQYSAIVNLINLLLKCFCGFINIWINYIHQNIGNQSRNEKDFFSLKTNDNGTRDIDDELPELNSLIIFVNRVGRKLLSSSPSSSSSSDSTLSSSKCIDYIKYYLNGNQGGLIYLSLLLILSRNIFDSCISKSKLKKLILLNFSSHLFHSSKLVQKYLSSSYCYLENSKKSSHVSSTLTSIQATYVLMFLSFLTHQNASFKSNFIMTVCSDISTRVKSKSDIPVNGNENIGQRKSSSCNGKISLLCYILNYLYKNVLSSYPILLIFLYQLKEFVFNDHNIKLKLKSKFFSPRSFEILSRFCDQDSILIDHSNTPTLCKSSFFSLILNSAVFATDNDSSTDKISDAPISLSQLVYIYLANLINSNILINSVKKKKPSSRDSYFASDFLKPGNNFDFILNWILKLKPLHNSYHKKLILDLLNYHRLPDLIFLYLRRSKFSIDPEPNLNYFALMSFISSVISIVVSKIESIGSDYSNICMSPGSHWKNIIHFEFFGLHRLTFSKGLQMSGSPMTIYYTLMGIVAVYRLVDTLLSRLVDLTDLDCMDEWRSKSFHLLPDINVLLSLYKPLSSSEYIDKPCDQIMIQSLLLKCICYHTALFHKVFVERNIDLIAFFENKRKEPVSLNTACMKYDLENIWPFKKSFVDIYKRSILIFFSNAVTDRLASFCCTQLRDFLIESSCSIETDTDKDSEEYFALMLQSLDLFDSIIESLFFITGLIVFLRNEKDEKRKMSIIMCLHDKLTKYIISNFRSTRMDPVVKDNLPIWTLLIVDTEKHGDRQTTEDVHVGSVNGDVLILISYMKELWTIYKCGSVVYADTAIQIFPLILFSSPLKLLFESSDSGHSIFWDYKCCTNESHLHLALDILLRKLGNGNCFDFGFRYITFLDSILLHCRNNLAQMQYFNLLRLLMNNHIETLKRIFVLPICYQIRSSEPILLFNAIIGIFSTFFESKNLLSEAREIFINLWVENVSRISNLKSLDCFLLRAILGKNQSFSFASLKCWPRCQDREISSLSVKEKYVMVFLRLLLHTSHSNDSYLINDLIKSVDIINHGISILIETKEIFVALLLERVLGHLMKDGVTIKVNGLFLKPLALLVLSQCDSCESWYSLWKKIMFFYGDEAASADIFLLISLLLDQGRFLENKCLLIWMTMFDLTMSIILNNELEYSKKYKSSTRNAAAAVAARQTLRVYLIDKNEILWEIMQKGCCYPFSSQTASLCKYIKWNGLRMEQMYCSIDDLELKSSEKIKFVHMLLNSYIESKAIFRSGEEESVDIFLLDRIVSLITDLNDSELNSKNLNIACHLIIWINQFSPSGLDSYRQSLWKYLKQNKKWLIRADNEDKTPAQYFLVLLLQLLVPDDVSALDPSCSKIFQFFVKWIWQMEPLMSLMNHLSAEDKSDYDTLNIFFHFTKILNCSLRLLSPRDINMEFLWIYSSRWHGTCVAEQIAILDLFNSIEKVLAIRTGHIIRTRFLLLLMSIKPNDSQSMFQILSANAKISFRSLFELLSAERILDNIKYYPADRVSSEITEAHQIYDPLFLIYWIRYIFSLITNEKTFEKELDVANLEVFCHQFVVRNLLSYCIISLSSVDSSIREVAIICLDSFSSLLANCQLKEHSELRQVYWLLTILRSQLSISSSQQVSCERVEKLPQFFLHSLIQVIVRSPDSELYVECNRYLLQRSRLNILDDLELFWNIFYPTTSSNSQGTAGLSMSIVKEWKSFILDILIFGMTNIHCTLESTNKCAIKCLSKIYRSRYIWEHLLTFLLSATALESDLKNLCRVLHLISKVAQLTDLFLVLVNQYALMCHLSSLVILLEKTKKVNPLGKKQVVVSLLKILENSLTSLASKSDVDKIIAVDFYRLFRLLVGVLDNIYLGCEHRSADVIDSGPHLFEEEQLTRPMMNIVRLFGNYDLKMSSHFGTNL